MQTHKAQRTQSSAKGSVNLVSYSTKDVCVH